MAWLELLFGYCERGRDSGLGAEPLNVLSSCAFFVAALLARRQARHRIDGGSALWPPLLIGLGGLVGLGSVVFHAWPTRLGRIADVVPIAIFMAAYLVWCSRALLALTPIATMALMSSFGLVSIAAGSVVCDRLVQVPVGMRVACLNGTFTYLPALALLIGIAATVRRRHAHVARLLGLAALCFGLAMLARTFDLTLCASTRLWSRPLGLHWLWHLLVAASLHLLLRATIDQTNDDNRKAI